jgi:Dolichyl-phosphate-mannose-protein mannosyltransferase
MTAVAVRPPTYPRLRSEHPPPLRHWAAPRLRGALALRRRGLAWLTPVLVIGAVVHAWGMFTFPGWVDDPGTYLSQAWSVVYEGNLSPYSYFYDHAPAGWIQIAAWAALTDGFDRYDSAIGFGNECMLIAKVVSIGLLYWLGRRLRFSRPAAAGVGLLFALSPVALAYTRWTFLDNLVTPWIVLSFALALSRKRSLIGAIGAGLAFGMAALTKETTLVLAPVLLYLLIQNSDRRNRSHVLVMSLGLSGLLMSAYLVYAMAKGEFFPGPGHNSLIGTAEWQLSGREGSGSVLDPNSSVSKAISGWLTYDPWLPLGGLATVPLLVFVRRLRPVVLCLALQTYVLVRGGYVPAMQVVNFLPWCAVAIPGAVEVLRGNLELRPRLPRPRRREDEGWTLPLVTEAAADPPTEPLRLPSRRAGLIRTATVLAVLAVLCVPVVRLWTPTLVTMTTTTQPPELYQAAHWIADNVPRNQFVVVHDAIWTDLVQQDGFAPDNVIMAYKLDADPAVHQRLHELDYLVVPDWYYTAQNGKYPTLIEAQQHAVPVAHFGTGADAVTIWHVSDRWRP